MPHFSYQMPLGMISFGTQRGITVREKKRKQKVEREVGGENSCCRRQEEWMSLSCQKIDILSAKMVKSQGLKKKIPTLRCCQNAWGNKSDSNVKQRILPCSLLTSTKSKKRENKWRDIRTEDEHLNTPEEEMAFLF